MAVDFHKIDKSDVKFSIDDNTMNLIEKSIDDFNERYSSVFDIYGKFRLYKNHQEYLRELLIPLKVKSQAVANFIVLLDECIKTETVLVGIGD